MEQCCLTLPCDRSDWAEVVGLIQQLCDVRSTQQACQLLLAIFQQVHGTSEDFIALTLLEDFLERDATVEERDRFVYNVLPAVANAAGRLKELKPKDGLQFCKQKRASSIRIQQDFLTSLIAHCFLCTIPLGQQLTVHPFAKFLYRSKEGSSKNQYFTENLRCIFSFFENYSDNSQSDGGGAITYTHNVFSSEEPSIKYWLDSQVELCPFVDSTSSDDIESYHKVIQLCATESRTGASCTAGHCMCAIFIPILLFWQPLVDNDVLEVSGLKEGLLYEDHIPELTVIAKIRSKDYVTGSVIAVRCSVGRESQLEILHNLNAAYLVFQQTDTRKEVIGQEELDSIYHDAIDQSVGSIESDYETAPESIGHESILSTYELVSGYSNSLSKAITNCAIYDVVRSRKPRRGSHDSRSSHTSSSSSHRSIIREQLHYTEPGHSVSNLAQYYCQDTDRLHVNLFRRRSSNELSSHHSTSLSEFGSEMDEYFGKKICAITEDESQAPVEDFADTMASSVLSHGLHTASSLIPGIQKFEAKQPVDVVTRPIALRPSPDSISPELSSDGQNSNQGRLSVNSYVNYMVEMNMSNILTSANCHSDTVDKFQIDGSRSDIDNGLPSVKGTLCRYGINYNIVEKLANDLVEKLISDVVMRKKSASVDTQSNANDNELVFDATTRACFVEAIEKLAGRVVEMAIMDAHGVIRESVDAESDSINEEEYSIISPMSSLKESESYDFIQMESASEASSSPVIIGNSFTVEECVERILQDSFTEIENIKCGVKCTEMPKELNLCQATKDNADNVAQFVERVVDTAFQKLKLKGSNGSNRNLSCLATTAAVSFDVSKFGINNAELFQKYHKLELPELIDDKELRGNSITLQEAEGIGAHVLFNRSNKTSMSDITENSFSGEDSRPAPSTPPPTPNSLTKNNFDIAKAGDEQQSLEEALLRRFSSERFVFDDSSRMPIDSVDSLATRLASAAISDGIHKVCRREKKPSSASTFTEDLLKIGNIDITGKRPSCTEENIAIFREELRRASIEQEKEFERRGSQLSDFADELESASFKENVQEIPNHIQEFAYELANNILASAFRQQFGDDSEPTRDSTRQQSGIASVDPAAQERNLLAMATNLANSIVASALQALRDGQAAEVSRQREIEAAQAAMLNPPPNSTTPTGKKTHNPQLKSMMQWLSASQARVPGASCCLDGKEDLDQLKEVCQTVLQRGWRVGDLTKAVTDYTQIPEADSSETLFDYILRISQI